LNVVGVTKDRTVGADAVLELEVMVAAGTKDAFELLTSEPLVQSIEGTGRSRETIQPIAAVNQDVATQHAKFVVQFMRVADDHDPQGDSPANGGHGERPS
jgi:hypothetical protein